MKLLFIIDTKQTYRIFSPIIDLGKVLNHEITICHINIPDVKNAPSINIFPFTNTEKNTINIIELNSFKDLKNFISKSKPFDFYISLYPILFILDEKIKKKISGKWVILQTGFDTYYRIWEWNNFTTIPLLQDYERIILTYTNELHSYCLDIIDSNKEVNNHENSSFFREKCKLINIGFCDVDEHLEALNKNDIRNKYCIPNNKEVFLYLPFPFFLNYHFKKGFNSKYWQSAFTGIFQKLIQQKNSNCIERLSGIFRGSIKRLFMYFLIFLDRRALHWYIHGLNEKNLMKSMRKFCDKNDLYFVVKNRKKHLGISSASDIAHLVVNDDEDTYYPTVFQELLSISKIVSGYHSTAVFESVAMKSFYINIICPEIFFRGYSAVKKIQDHSNSKIYNFKGVVSSIEIKKIINEFSSTSINNFSLDHRQVKKYENLYINSDKLIPRKNFYNTLEKIQ